MNAEPVPSGPIGPEALTGVASSPPLAIADLLAALESLSRAHPDRVLRLIGTLPPAPTSALGSAVLDSTVTAAVSSAATGGQPPLAPLPSVTEPFELLIFRGFSSLTTHPTAFDPDRAALPEGALIDGAELLAAPLDPQGGVPLAGPLPAQAFLQEGSWL
jgi:hypothetical protein